MFKLRRSLFLGVILSASSLFANEIRHIKPPKLDSAHLGEKILCHRPMRQGSPQMSVEKIGDQVIAHNYGHGGSGWTLGPGAARYVNDLLIDSEYSDDLRFDPPIVIIGAGTIGLYTAYDLVKKGYTNIYIVAENFDSLTSHNAGGLLAPVSMDNEPEMQSIIDEIGIDAYKFYAQIAEKDHPDFKKGAAIVPTYFENRENSGLEPYVGKVMQEAKDVVLDFGNGTQRKMVSYDDGIFIDASDMMHSLTSFLKAHDVQFAEAKITSFEQIQTKFIINCSGLGAAELNNDKEMVSVQGHLIMLKDQEPEDLQHVILVYFNEDTTASGFNVKRSFYMLPKHLENTDPRDVGVIGGTFIYGADAEIPHNEEFKIMLEGAKNFYGIKTDRSML